MRPPPPLGNTVIEIRAGVPEMIALALNQDDPANTRRWANAVLMLGWRLRRWPNIKTTFAERLVFAREACVAGGEGVVTCTTDHTNTRGSFH